MSNLIERLRDMSERTYPDDLMDEAADALEAMRQELHAEKAIQVTLSLAIRSRICEIERLVEANKTMLLMGAKSQERIAELESALENSYCELCGCAECLEREQALKGDNHDE